MAGVDNRVVSMDFQSGKFESGVQRTLSLLDKLKAALKFDGAGKGLKDIETAAGNTRFQGITNAVDNLTSKFSALRVLGLAALAGIAAQAVTAGASLIKAFTFDPVVSGLREYETNLNSVQTILANTQASGAKLKDVNAALQELNTYSDKTIYNFSEMAKNIGTFTAAGVDLKTSVESIKGIANLAALSGSNSQQASSAMYQLSQAIASGKVGLQDWNSVVNAGMGGTVFQRALATTAATMGTLEKSSVKLVGPMKNVSISGQSFRESIAAKPGEKSWLTSDVLTTTLKQFTGDLSDAELKAIGFNKAQIQSIQATAKTAMLAATQVKTLSGVFDVAKETAGSGWAQTFQIIFGDFEEAKKLFTGLSTTVSGFIANSASNRNTVLAEWKELGGRTDVIEGIKAAFVALFAIIKPITAAFRQIFPAATGKDLADLSAKFREFAEGLKIGATTAANLQRTFAGFFAVLSIGRQIIAGVFHILGDLLGAATSGSGGFLEFTGSIGDFLVAVDNAMKQGDAFKKVISAIGDALAAPIAALSSLGGGLLDGLFGVQVDPNTSENVSVLSKVVSGLGEVLDSASGAWRSFLDAVKSVGRALAPLGDAIKSVFTGIGDAISNAADDGTLATGFAALGAALTAGIGLMIKRFLGNLGGKIGGGIFGNIGESFDALTGSLTAMQQNIQAGTLLKIAGAVALLTASVAALSLIKAEDLQKSLGALAVAFGQLLAAMAILVKISGVAGFVKLPIIAASMILLAVAVDTLVIAVAALSNLSWDELQRGLVGVGALLGIVATASIPLSAAGPRLAIAGYAMISISVALKILSGVVKTFGELDYGVVRQGLLAVAFALTAVAIASRAFPTGMIAIGVGLIAVGAGLKLLTSSVSKLGTLEYGVLRQGLIGVGLALLAIGVAMRAFPPGIAAQAVGLILVGVALQGITQALSSLGGLSVSQLTTGLIALAGSLAILAIGLKLMTGTIGGSIALGIAAGALLLLAPALKILGSMSWGSIAKGLVTLAASLAIIGVAGLLLTPVIPALLGLGAAMVLIGAGIALVGGGFLLISAGLSALAVAGPAGIALLTSAIVAFIALIPQFVTGFVNGLVTMVVKVAEAMPQLVAAFAKIIVGMAQAIVVALPAIAKAFTAIIQAILQVISDNFPDIVRTGFEMLMALLQGVYDNIGEITIMVVKIVGRFIETLVSLFGDLVANGAELLGQLISGITSKFGDLAKSARDGVGKFTNGITNKLDDAVRSGIDIVKSVVSGISSKIEDLAEKGAKIISKTSAGIADKLSDMTEKGGDIVGRVVKGIGDALSDMTEAGGKIISHAVSGATSSIGDLVTIGTNIINGVISGVTSAAGRLARAAANAVKDALSSAKHAVGIKSPSTAFRDEVGVNMILGVVTGIDNTMPMLERSAENAASNALGAMASTLKLVPDLLNDIVDTEPTITPVLDLTKFQEEAKKLNGLTNIIPINASASFGQATAITIAQETNQQTADAAAVDTPPIQFIQNNNSPESLSETEIYRQTKNQLSQAKDLLGVA